MNNLLKLIENYSTDDMFNIDKTGLFFKCLPEKTFLQLFKGYSCSGGKYKRKSNTSASVRGKYVGLRKVKTTFAC